MSLWKYPHLEQSYPADGGGVEGPGVGVVDGLPRLDHRPRHDRDHVVVGEGEPGVLVAAEHRIIITIIIIIPNLCIIMAAAGNTPEMVSPAPLGHSSKQLVSKIPHKVCSILSWASCSRWCGLKYLKNGSLE